MPATPTVTVETLKQWLDADQVSLIDVREEDEYLESSIPRSSLQPLSSFDPEDIPWESGKKIVFQCRSGQRSDRACFMFLQEFPQAEAYNLEGGIMAWQQAGYPLQRIKSENAL